MKNTITTISFAGLILAYFILLSNSSGALPVFTGAPGEQTCGISSCHNTMSNQGNAMVSIDFDGGQTNFEFGSTYPVQIKITGAMNMDKNGFEIVALDQDDNNLGNWTISGGDVQQKNGSNSRTYLTHTLSGSTKTQWDFMWEAPSAGATEVNFYVAAIDANDNSNKVGDDMYTVSKTILGPTSSIDETNLNDAFIVAPNPVNTTVNIIARTKDRTATQLFLMDSQGKQVQQAQNENSLDMGHLSPGLYFLIIEDSKGKRSSKKLLKI